MNLNALSQHSLKTQMRRSNSAAVAFRLSAPHHIDILHRMYRTQDLHVKEIVPLLSPRALKGLSPTPVAVNDAVAKARERVNRILRQEDPRMLVVIGPCSIHDQKSSLEYATRLSSLQKEM